MVQTKGRGEHPKTTASINPFKTLNTSIEIPETRTEEIEQQVPSLEAEKKNIEVTQLDSPTGTSSSPTYAEMTRKKPPKTSRSSEDETFKRPSKIVGRKSHKEAREEEVERQKMKGSQSTIEMPIGRNTRTSL